MTEVSALEIEIKHLGFNVKHHKSDIQEINKRLDMQNTNSVELKGKVDNLYDKLGNGWCEKMEQALKTITNDLAIITTDVAILKEHKKAISHRIKDWSMIVVCITAICSLIIQVAR